MRAELDDWLFRLLTGYIVDKLGHESKLRTLAQKAALLSALQPVDRLRALSVVRPILYSIASLRKQSYRWLPHRQFLNSVGLIACLHAFDIKSWYDYWQLCKHKSLDALLGTWGAEI